ncbi:CCA tRNA nucleotidyltransferase [Bryobacter aggregatus]|uniref:CCA tRNA nucleotidyltransferase n=1 Tax=Bryobacter aggregatus TaxID=360054 RepID=UPI0004E1B9A3|nr:[cytidine(C)-cytidine(C)-adenosine (A)]-adding enzyme [Bryobacter aggregatus]
MDTKSKAREIVVRLRQEGYAAYWVGGCVRDPLLGLEPQDYDVATSARPQQVIELFPGADAVGASFGVVLTDGIEVATFRSEAAYQDGRHPDQVRYETDPKLDAARRDFTINAIFYDPLTDGYLDFFGGRADIEAHLIRAVGVAGERFREDHLRLLRAIRFATRFAFTVEAVTWQAILQNASQIQLISAERIQEELNRMFTGPDPDRALLLLRESGLLRAIVPECRLERFPVPHPSLPLAWAALLQSCAEPRNILNALRFSNDSKKTILAILASQPRIATARDLPTAAFKKLIRQPNFADHLRLYGPHEIEDRIANTGDLFPAPLLNGADLLALGLPAGPRFKHLLNELEDAQLAGTVTSREEAIAFVLARW